jgi:hypothetical protein
MGVVGNYRPTNYRVVPMDRHADAIVHNSEP